MRFVHLFTLVIFTVFSAVDARLQKSLMAQNEHSGPRIIGGESAHSMADFPYQVSLKFDLGHFCGGSIISNRFILSAAHCVDYVLELTQIEHIFAHMGSLDVSSDGVDIYVDKITTHSGWNNKTRLNDIALFRTVREIIFSDRIKPIALPNHNLPENGNTPVILSGWGSYIFDSNVKPHILQFTKQTTISLKDCAERLRNELGGLYEIEEIIHPKIVCAFKESFVGTCFGDSGGPLVDVSDPKHKVLVGIVAWGIPCAKGFPDVYTRVYSYIDWIKEHTIIENNATQ